MLRVQAVVSLCIMGCSYLAVLHFIYIASRYASHMILLIDLVKSKAFTSLIDSSSTR